MSPRTIVIWGAGKIGRGFLADLFHAAGYHLILVDEAAELIDRLRAAGRYTVVRAAGPDQRQDVVIDDFRAFSTTQSEEVTAAVAAADIMALAVFPQDFDRVVRQLVPAIARRSLERPEAALDILLCTNLAHAGPQLRAALQDALPPPARSWADSHLGIVETLVIRMATEPPAGLRQQDPLLVWTNGHPDLLVDGQAFVGAVPQVPGLRLVTDMRAEETRKLYTYNLFQAVLAYLGALRGYELIVDCLADSEIRAAAEGALEEASRALQAEYGFTAGEMAAWNQNVVAQTNNPLLGDTVRRIGADPARKLRRRDRLVGPALLARRHGIATPQLIRATAAALHFQQSGDEGARHVHSRLAELGVSAAVRELCGLSEAEEDLAKAIVLAYRRLPLELEWAAAAQRAGSLGFEYEKRYHGCGQCTLAAVLDTLDRFDESAFEAATGLAGSIGLAGDGPCGALLGAVMAFGLLYPRRRAHFDDDRENKYRVYDMAQQLRERYVAYYGAMTCQGVHQHHWGRSFDLRDAAERQAFEAAGAHEDVCTGVVARAARWAVEIIAAAQIEDVLLRQD